MYLCSKFFISSTKSSGSDSIPDAFGRTLTATSNRPRSVPRKIPEPLTNSLSTCLSKLSAARRILYPAFRLCAMVWRTIVW